MGAGGGTVEVPSNRSEDSPLMSSNNEFDIMKGHPVCDGVHQPPLLGRFSGTDVSMVGTVSVSIRSAMETPRRELPDDVPFRIGTL